MAATEFGAATPAAGSPSTGPSPAAAAPAGIDVPPVTRFRRLAIAGSAVVGGLLTGAGFLTTVWETAPGTLAYLESLVVDPWRSQVAALLLHLGYLGLVPVLLALGIMTRSRWRIAGNIGLALGMGGALALPGLLVSDFYDLAIRQSLPLEQAVAVSDAAHALPLAGLIGGPLIMGTVVGMTLLSVAAWRAGFFHWTFGALLALSFVLPPMPETGALQGVVQGAPLALFMIAAGVAVIRMTDEEWVSGLRGAGR